jgi:concanavalin A-like lectin/glucanase superfamily protein/surface protein with Ig-like domain/type IX secretion system substrate protein
MKAKLLLNQKNFLIAFVFMAFLQTAFSQVTITPWKMNKGGGAINYSLPNHGNPLAYSQMHIPSIADPNWTAAPVDSNGAINFNPRSILSRCLQQLDFTYFETFINIPANFNVSSLNVAFSAADDGARAYIFNSAHPNGAFIGQISLGGSPTSVNYASLTVAGESNRLVVVQFDDCPSGNTLRGAKVNVNGSPVAISTGGCTTSHFFWSNAPTVIISSPKKAFGTINGIGYTYTSSVNINTTSSVYSIGTFPSSYNVPNNNPTIRNDYISSNTLTFNSPMKNPVLVFASIGNSGQAVPIKFNNPVEVLWSTATTINSPTQITGREGYAIVRMNGTFSSISFDYLANESWVNFVFGADFSTSTPDTMAPTVTLNGSATMSLNAGATFTDPGATVSDNCDTNPTLMTSGTVNTNVPGTHTLTYNAVDASGNVSGAVTRTVTVLDATPPTVLTKNITVPLDASGNASIQASDIDNGSNDASGAVTLSLGVGQGNFSCANVGVNTVSLIVTDTQGNTATGTAQVTIQDVTPPGGGGATAPAGLGAVPAIALNNVPEAAGFGLLYQLDIPDVAGWTTGVPYAVDNSALTGLNFSKVAYLLQLDNKWVWVSMDAFTTNLVELGLPQQSQVGHSFSKQQNVNNLSVVASSNSGLATRQNVATGNIEIWNYNYAPQNASNVPNADPNNYDWGDTNFGSSNYSSFQVHDHGAQQVLLAYNRWGRADVSDIGINNNTGNAHKDYTFMSNAGNYSVKKLYVFVGDSSTGSGGVLTQDITVNLDANGHATITPQMIDNGTTDNCGIASYSLDKTTFTCADMATNPNTVTLTVTDNNGNSATGTATVTVVDNTAPVISLNGAANITVNAFLPYTDAGATATDNCVAPSVTVGGTVDTNTLGTYTLTYDAVDASGNNATQVTRTVTVADATPPTVVTQDITVNLDASGNASITPQQIDNGSSDDSGTVTLSLDKMNFTCADVAGGGTCNANSLSFNGTGIALANSGTGITDISNNGFTLESWVYPTAYGLNSIIRKTGDYNLYLNGSVLTAEVWADASSNWKIVTGPSGVALNQWTHVAFTWDGSSGQFYVNGVQSAGTVTVNSTINGSEALGIGSSTIYHQSFRGQIDDVRIWSVARSATDINSAKSTCLSGNETGLAAYYKIASGTGNILTDYSINGNTATISGPTWSTNAPTQTSQGTGNTVTLTATDPSGNSATGTATVTVLDTTAPMVVTQDITVQLDATGNASIAAIDLDGGTTDNCGAVTFSLDAGQGNFTCANVGTNTVTLVATDNHGNVATGTANVTVQDVTPPTVVTQNITVQLDATGNAVLDPATLDAGSSDNCGPVTFSLDAGQGNFTCTNVGVNTVNLVVTDAHGNSAFAPAQVTVEDNIAPTVVTQAFTTTIMGGVATVTAADVDGGSYDNCSIQSMSVSPTTFVCGDQGNHTVTLTVTDNSGNVSTAPAIVTVVGEVPTIAIDTFTAVPTQSTNTVYLGYGPQSITLTTQTTGGTGFTYAWTASTGEIVSSVANPTISPLVSTTYTVTVTNANGCEATTSLDVCVIDARYINKEGEWDDGKVLLCKGSDDDDDDDHASKDEGDDDHSDKDDDHESRTKAKKAKDVEKYLKKGYTLGACNATCTTTYVEVIVDNDDDDHGDDNHADNDGDKDDDKGDNGANNDDHNSSESNKTKVIIYPNPVEDEAGVALNLKKKGKGEIKVYDYKGRKIFSKKTKDLKKGVKVNMRAKKEGTYFVRIKYKGKVYTATLLKER